MRVPGLKTAKIATRWLQARTFGGAIILGYHRVANVSDDVYQVCVSPKNFTQQMEVLSRYTHITSLAKLVEYLMVESLPPRTIAVTFDDGYADVLYKAKPVLEKFQIPATIFVCSGFIGKEFWWDELERLVVSSQADVTQLHLRFGDNQLNWDQNKSDPETGSRKNRRRFLHALYRFLLSLDRKDQNRAMIKIRGWSGIPSDETPGSRAMRDDELVCIADGGLIDLGSHTRYHPMLPQLSLQQQREEILSSKRDLEALVGKEIEGFSYPNGQTTEDSKRIVQETGYSYACSSEPNVIRSSRNIYQVPRFWPKDWDGDAFTHWLKKWCGRL